MVVMVLLVGDDVFAFVVGDGVVIVVAVVVIG